MIVTAAMLPRAMRAARERTANFSRDWSFGTRSWVSGRAAFGASLRSASVSWPRSCIFLLDESTGFVLFGAQKDSTPRESKVPEQNEGYVIFVRRRQIGSRVAWWLAWLARGTGQRSVRR